MLAVLVSNPLYSSRNHRISIVQLHKIKKKNTISHIFQPALITFCGIQHDRVVFEMLVWASVVWLTGVSCALSDIGYRQLEQTSLTDCTSICGHDDRCKSILFDHRLLQCHFYNLSLTDADSSPGTILRAKSNQVRIFILPCIYIYIYIQGRIYIWASIGAAQAPQDQRGPHLLTF